MAASIAMGFTVALAVIFLMIAVSLSLYFAYTFFVQTSRSDMPVLTNFDFHMGCIWIFEGFFFAFLAVALLMWFLGW